MKVSTIILSAAVLALPRKDVRPRSPTTSTVELEGDDDLERGNRNGALSSGQRGESSNQDSRSRSSHMARIPFHLLPNSGDPVPQVNRPGQNFPSDRRSIGSGPMTFSVSNSPTPGRNKEHHVNFREILNNANRQPDTRSPSVQNSRHSIYGEVSLPSTKPENTKVEGKSSKPYLSKQPKYSVSLTASEKRNPHIHKQFANKEDQLKWNQHRDEFIKHMPEILEKGHYHRHKGAVKSPETVHAQIFDKQEEGAPVNPESVRFVSARSRRNLQDTTLPARSRNSGRF